MALTVAQKVERFFAGYPLRHFDKNQILIQAEEDPPGIFYLVAGRITQYDISPLGTEIILNVFKPGAFLPMSWAINKTPNHYFFGASTALTVRQAPADDVMAFLKENPDVLLNLLSRVYSGTDGLLRRTAHILGGDAKSRLLYELLNATYRFGEAQADGTLFVPLKESDIAKHAGLARETVSRTIQDLKTVGLVEVKPSGIVLTNLAKLEEMLGNDV